VGGLDETEFAITEIRSLNDVRRSTPLRVSQFHEDL
jgi:hypothetical protein